MRGIPHQADRGPNYKPILAGFIAATLLGLASSQAGAGMVIGLRAGNDNANGVLNVISAYNAANNPDLSTNFSLFKKTDDDSAFVFNAANGFRFYSNPAGTAPIATESGLTTRSTAYFTYTGTTNLLYYSVKSGNQFKLYAFASGLNLLNLASQNISHVSFWSGPAPAVAAPEPGTCALALLGLGSLAGNYGLGRIRKGRRPPADLTS